MLNPLYKLIIDIYVFIIYMSWLVAGRIIVDNEQQQQQVSRIILYLG